MKMYREIFESNPKTITEKEYKEIPNQWLKSDIFYDWLGDYYAPYELWNMTDEEKKHVKESFFKQCEVWLKEDWEEITPVFVCFQYDTPLGGDTRGKEYKIFDSDIERWKLDDIADERCQTNAEFYADLIFDEEDERFLTEGQKSEMLDSFFSECSRSWEFVSEEEYLEHCEG